MRSGTLYEGLGPSRPEEGDRNVAVRSPVKVPHNPGNHSRLNQNQNWGQARSYDS
jgi:hypothetical protein